MLQIYLIVRSEKHFIDPIVRQERHFERVEFFSVVPVNIMSERIEIMNFLKIQTILTLEYIPLLGM